MSEKRSEISESTIARMAGNILSGMLGNSANAAADWSEAAKHAVRIARAIAAEVERTQPKEGV